MKYKSVNAIVNVQICLIACIRYKGRFALLCNQTHYIQVHYKSYFTTQYFKSFFTFLLYINGLCFTMHVILHSVSVKHDNGVDCYDCEIQTNVNALCAHRMDISLCIILPHDRTLQELEHV